ncbi:MAG: hypothetical protein ACP5QT_00230 [Brevinematia bacterium]
MTLKKVILVLLLIFSIISLFVIVYFSKNRVGMFGKIYDEHVRKNTELISQTVQSNMLKVKDEIKSLSQEETVKAIFESYFLGLAPVDSTRISEIKNKIPECIKIQLIDKDGLIIFSTIEEEKLSQKLKSTILEKIQSHFSLRDEPFFYFLNNQQFFSLFPLSYAISNSIYYGYVAVYYNTAKLLSSAFPAKKLKIPFSSENFVFFSTGNIDPKDISLILQNYENLKDIKGERFEKTIGGISQFNGIKLIYYAKNEKFISPWTIFFIIIDLILLLLVVFTLLQISREEKLYKEVALSSLKTDTVTEDRSEIGDLVKDIEEENIYREEEAKEGIEEMMMSEQTEFSAVSEKPVLPSEKEIESSLAEKPYEVKEEMVEVPFEVSEETFEPDHKTKVFAEEENILSGMSNEYIEKEIALKEEPEKAEEIETIERTIEFEMPEVENVPLTENLGQIEEAMAVTSMEPLKETIEEREIDLKNEMAEPPQKTSTIATVEDYGSVALDLSKNNLGISRVMILKRENSHFIPVIQEGFKSSEVSFDIDDPLIKLFFSKGKCVDIKGNLKSRYLSSKFLETDLNEIEELFIMPIIKKNEIVGVAFYGRESGVPEATNFQKSELFNMGYLQEN